MEKHQHAAAWKGRESFLEGCIVHPWDFLRESIMHYRRGLLLHTIISFFTATLRTIQFASHTKERDHQFKSIIAHHWRSSSSPITVARGNHAPSLSGISHKKQSHGTLLKVTQFIRQSSTRSEVGHKRPIRIFSKIGWSFFFPQIKDDQNFSREDGQNFFFF